MIAAGSALFLVPFGTIGGGILLFLLLGEKGSEILSQDYHELIQRTPHIEEKTVSLLAWALLAGFVLASEVFVVLML